ncbi:MAG TPA: type II toxin-antitoxin system HicB family antitoxin [Stellaceae bacterium]|jgi:antitoxin HicB|nr:type II toxin-antitoxin system HicB family antitoxin [Stellaceae bacterium]
MYPVVLEPDDNGTLLVMCPDLPEVTTWGEDEDDALRHAADAIEEALAGIIARREPLPEPARLPAGTGAVHIPTLPPLTEAKIALYRAAYEARVSKAELGRRLGWHAPQVDRLFDLGHHSRIEQIDQALRALGKRLSLSVRDAA